MFSSKRQYQSHFLYNQLVPGEKSNNKDKEDKANHKELQREQQQLHYLTDHNIIRASIIV